MPDTFSCPTCGAPLSYQAGDGETIPCPYCRSSVIVPAELRNARPGPVPHNRVDELLLPQIRDLLARHQKIEAIKLVRQNIATGLKEAKDAVDEIEAGRRNSLADLGIAPDPSISSFETAPIPRVYSGILVVVVGLVVFMVAAVVIFVFLQPAPPAILPIKVPLATAAPTPVLVPTPQFALHVSTPATGGGAHGMLFDRQDNLFLQDMTKVTRYALREK